MKTFLNILISLLLIFNGVGALYGGWNLMMHPDGSRMQMSLDFLRNTPFQNYFIPGVILFCANGLFSIFILLALIVRFRTFSWLVMIQGAILCGWIFIQVLMIQTIISLHIIMGSVGIALMISGWIRMKFYPAEISEN